jgi:hypothetical protein
MSEEMYQSWLDIIELVSTVQFLFLLCSFQKRRTRWSGILTLLVFILPNLSVELLTLEGLHCSCFSCLEFKNPTQSSFLFVVSR